MTSAPLRPEEIRHWQANLEDLANPLALATSANIARLLASHQWYEERVKELEKALGRAIDLAEAIKAHPYQPWNYR